MVLKKSLWGRREELSNQFFIDVLEITSEAFIGALFPKAIFTSSGTIDPVQELGGYNDEEDATQPSRAIKLRLNIDDTHICRTSVDFGCCFSAGSIASVGLRNEHHLQSSQILSDALVRFSSCSDSSGNLYPDICLTCTEELVRIAHMHVEFIPPAARICIALGSCVGCRQQVDIRELFKAVSRVLRRSS